MIVIPFLLSHERDATDTRLPENIISALTPEFPAIVRVFAEYYMRLKKDYGGIIPISKESNSYKADVIAEVETDLDKFINVNVSFEKNQKVRIKDVYEKYLAYYEFDENSAKRGEALSRIRFTKFILKNYKDLVYESTQRVGGNEPARAFIGMRLKSLDEIAEAEAAKESGNNASPQVLPKPAAEPEPWETPAVEPIEENPFG
jgi:uncharacterized protein YdcH (DUF465 family)